ncbi:hypothetical protein ACHAPT_013450 [Fusarium lateritium]
MDTPQPAVAPFRDLFNGKLLFTACILALSQFNFGFEGAAFTNIQAMSLLIGNRVTDRFGRRLTVRVMCIWTIICTIILLTARSSDQMMAGRALNYLYIGMELAVIPLYQAEITPLQARGAMVASYNTALLSGMLIMSLICYGTSEIPSRASYLLPIGLFYIVPSIVLACTFFMPESPRWLVLRERHEEAMESLRQLREGKFSEEQIQEEMAVIRAACESNQYKPTEVGFLTRWLQIWSRKHIKRTGIILATNFFLHGTGNAFASMYGTLFFKSIGTVNPFVLSVINSVITLIISVTTLALVDKVGRRPLLLTGSSIQASALLIMGGLGMMSNATYSVKSGIIAMMMIFGGGYCAAWGQLSHTITAEIPSSEVRDVTYTTGPLLAIGTQAAMTFGLPYMLNEPYAALGPRVGFIFGSIAAVSVIFAFFCVPECYGKSLEEVEALFNKKVPIRRFKKTHIRMLSDANVKGDAPDHKEFRVGETAV